MAINRATYQSWMWEACARSVGRVRVFAADIHACRAEIVRIYGTASVQKAAALQGAAFQALAIVEDKGLSVDRPTWSDGVHVWGIVGTDARKLWPVREGCILQPV